MNDEGRHPLADFVYCPHCGEHSVQPQNCKAIRCSACGFVYYANASAAVGCFVVNPQGDLLIVRRAFDPYAGTWDLPGGFVDPGETVERAVEREIAEETGLSVRGFEYLFSLPNIYPFSGHAVHTTDLFFLAFVDDYSGGHPSDDVSEMRWMPIDEIRIEDFGLASIKAAMQITVHNKSFLVDRER